MLDVQIQEGPHARDGQPVIVLMHGRGADPSDLAGLRPWLTDEAAVVLPRAPFPGAPWGYGPGWAWYRYEGDDVPDEESFRSSQAALDELLEALPRVLGYRPGPVVVGGFSQGGTMSLGRALRVPGGVAGVLNFSGFVPRHPDVVVTPESARAQPFFWGHGTADPAVPFSLAERGRSALEEAGAQLHSWTGAIGHAIAPPELEEAAAWLERLLTPAADGP